MAIEDEAYADKMEMVNVLLYTTHEQDDKLNILQVLARIAAKKLNPEYLAVYNETEVEL